MVRIYTWGDGAKVAPFDAESVAIARFVAKHCDSDVELFPTSDYLSSFTGKLPYMEIEGGQVHGFKAIVKRLVQDGQCHYQMLTGDKKFTDDGFVDYILEQFGVITNYNLFLNKDNYVGYVRPMFKDLLPFPLQYKPPMQFRDHAVQVCDEYGISADDDAEVAAEMDRINAQQRELEEQPVLNELQRKQLEKQIADLAARKSLLTNMKCMTLLQEVMDQKDNLSIQDGISEDLLFGFITANTMPQLKSGFVREYLQQHYPLLLDSPEAEVSFESEPLNLPGALKGLICTYI